MDPKPFTIEEAAEICEDFEDLIDTEFKIGTSPLLLVVHVSIAPFQEADKNSFVEAYSQTKDSQAALNGYPGNDYDVILITAEADNETSYSYMDIRTFTQLKGIKYAFPE